MDTYNIELARNSLNQAVNELRHAEQYCIKAGLVGQAESLSRTISAAENRNKELGRTLIFDE